jgi:5-methylcytosine-specific restriction enzyme subunit McrC
MSGRKPFLIQVGENDRLFLPYPYNTNRIIDRILLTSDRLPFNAIIRDRRGLRTNGFVGLLDAGSVQIEILPKISDILNLEDSRAFLFNILSYSGFSTITASLSAKTRNIEEPVIEQILHQYASLISTLLIRGAPRRYYPLSETLSVLKGRIQFERLATTGPSGSHKMMVRHTPLQRDNKLSQIVLAIVNYIQGLTRSRKTHTVLQQCRRYLSNVSILPLNIDLIDSVKPTRFEKEWQNIITFGRSLITGSSPNPTRAGMTEGFGLIFPLEHLFEMALRRGIRKVLIEKENELFMPKGRNFLLRSITDGREAISVRPDFLFRSTKRDCKLSFVGDAKWKKLKPQGRSYGLHAADVYQLLAYMRFYKLDNGLIFFPKMAWMEDNFSETYSFVGGKGNILLSVVDVEGLVSRDKRKRRKAESLLLETLQFASSFNVEP